MNGNKEKILIIEGACKKFRIGNKGPSSVLGKLVNLVSGREYKKILESVKNISFEASKGENIGLIGRNGSGKSTLLRLIAGIYRVDHGKITARGKVVYLNGFSNGLRIKLTMRENIYLMGSILGLRNNEIEKEFNEIVKFSGLEEFVDTKVYQFSSGMTTRLIFSVTIYCLYSYNPDILLLDEILSAGGDEEFKLKATAKIEELIRGGVTVIIASHNLNDIRKYCDKVVWLEKGEIVMSGRTEEVILKYQAWIKNPKENAY